MDFYDIIIRPDSAFGTPIKGDTLFGHFCWQTAHDPGLLGKKLERVIEDYPEKPFVIFSSAFPKTGDPEFPCLFKRPDIPLTWFVCSGKLSRKETILATKSLKACKWMKAGSDMTLEAEKGNLVSGDGAAGSPIIYSGRQAHNTINRMTGTTSTGRFTPFETDLLWFQPDTQLSIFVLVDPEILSLDGLLKGLERIGKLGFGRDASTGMGRFEIVESRALSLPDLSGSQGLYAMAPCLPEPGRFQRCYFTPFVRFGRHGDKLARSGQPFKNPVIMADEGVVLIPKAPVSTPYVGQAVTQVSKAMPQTVVQAYAPVLPIRFER